MELHINPNSRTSDLICRVIILFQVGMCQSLFHFNPFVRVESQHLVQQIQSCSTKTTKKEINVILVHTTRGRRNVQAKI